jgi:putative transcriptional regulator
VKVDDSDFQSLKRGLAQVESYRAGERKGFNEHAPIDIRAIRARTRMTQAQFARAYRLPLGTVKDWEQARRRPDAPARALLTIIERDPVEAQRLLADA